MSEEKPKFEKPTTPEEDAELVLARSEYSSKFAQDLEKKYGRDSLTGLMTREAFSENLDRAINAMQRGEQRKGVEPLHDLAVIFIDLDNFKQVNDKRGHLEGDKALIEVASVISDSIREGQDVVGRFGGDEFYAFLPRTKREGVRTVAEKILHNIRNSKLLSTYAVTASIGAFCATPQNSADMNAEDLIKRADTAQSRAKEEGKNTIVIDGAG